MLLSGIQVLFLLVLSLAVVVYLVQRALRFLRLERVVVFDYQRALVYKKGVLQRIGEPGVYWSSAQRHIIPVDLRRQLITLPAQEILTANGIAVKVSAVVEYSIVDPDRMAAASANFTQLTYSHGQTALRSAVSELTFDDLLTQREDLSGRISALLQEPFALTGAEVHSARLLDLMLPADVKRAFTQVLTAQKEGLAALERARSETAALRTLANAARLMQDHPGLLQLRAVQAMELSKGSATLELRMPELRVSDPQAINR